MSRTMKHVQVLAFLAAIAVGLHYATCYVVGGWTQQNPWNNVKYLELTKFAIKQQEEKTGFSSRYSALWLLKVETQIVSGVNYRIRFKIARRPCVKDGFPTSIRSCKHANYYGFLL
ncbi:cystatin-1-like isoform X2 [Amblyomma americanum]